MALTEAQQAYLTRVKLVSNAYTKAGRVCDNARRHYKKNPSENTLAVYYSTIEKLEKARDDYYR